jgi:lactate permease
LNSCSPVRDCLLSVLPIVTVLFLMWRLRWSGVRSCAVGWALALAVACAYFGADLRVLWLAQAKAALLAAYVIYVIWGALLFYHTSDEAGATETLGSWLRALTPHRGSQALLLGWVFSGFLQGIGGFGVPVAVVAPILVNLGFGPVAATAIPSIGHAWAVTFGSLGSSFYALMAATQLPGSALGPSSAVALGLVCLASGTAVLWIAGGFRSLLEGTGLLVCLGSVMVVTQYATVVLGGWSVGALVAAAAGLAAGVGLALRRPLVTGAPTPNHTHGITNPRLLQAAAPYGLLIVIVAVSRLTAVSAMLDNVVFTSSFPRLTTSRGWVVEGEMGRTISVFGHPGALMTYASGLTYCAFRFWRSYQPGAASRILRNTVQRLVRTGAATALMVGLALTMQHAGMTQVLAQGLATAAGSALPAAAPLIGALGAFVTGSNTNSNVMFGNLQLVAAHLVGISPQIILAAQTAGGAVGSVFAPAKVIVGCSTVAADEGAVLTVTMRYGAAILAVVASATWLAVNLGRSL